MEQTVLDQLNALADAPESDVATRHANLKIWTNGDEKQSEFWAGLESLFL